MVDVSAELSGELEWTKFTSFATTFSLLHSSTVSWVWLKESCTPRPCTIGDCRPMMSKNNSSVVVSLQFFPPAEPVLGPILSYNNKYV